jgi:hypothetical protein
MKIPDHEYKIYSSQDIESYNILLEPVKVIRLKFTGGTITEISFEKIGAFYLELCILCHQNKFMLNQLLNVLRHERMMGNFSY